MFGDVTEVKLQSGEKVSSSVEGRLSTLIAAIRGKLDGEVSSEKIHTLNFDEDMKRAKKVANELLHDESISSVESLYHENESQSSIYRFSSDVAVERVDPEIDDNKYVGITGFEGKVRFHGNTSMDNWGSRSSLITALGADVPYPFQGLVSPLSLESNQIEHQEYSVQFLLICNPTKESREDWYNRQNIRQELL
jgi:hypothetical protein